LRFLNAARIAERPACTHEMQLAPAPHMPMLLSLHDVVP